MKKNLTDKVAADRDRFAKTIDIKIDQKLNARNHPQTKIWMGLSMMGLVGWSVVTPVLLGVALGLWLDKIVVSDHSWTLALLATGLIVGCINAWNWIVKENNAMNEKKKKNDE